MNKSKNPTPYRSDSQPVTDIHSQRRQQISKIKLTESLKRILEEAALGTIGFIADTSPYSHRRIWTDIYRRLNAKTRGRRNRIQQKIHRLERDNILVLNNNEYQLTAKGQALLNRFKTDEIKIEPGKWDGKWRLVSYDLPTGKKSVRNNFRKALKRSGFVLVQKSLWVLPWKCQPEIEALTHGFDLAPYVILMTTETLPMEERLKKHFGV